MVIDQWNELTIREKTELTGKVIHLLMNDQDCFTALTSLVRSADQSGVFDDIKILSHLHNDNQQ